jgi:hypothetical protein
MKSIIALVLHFVIFNSLIGCIMYFTREPHYPHILAVPLCLLLGGMDLIVYPFIAYLEYDDYKYKKERKKLNGM